MVPLTIGRDGSWYDRGGRPIGLTGAASVLRSCDVAMPAVHGPHGEDGTLAALCELAGLPYVGSGVGAGAIAMDKWATKLVAEAVGVATVPGVLLTAATAAAYAWTGPVVVKPVAAGSSHGVTLVRDADELGAGARRGARARQPDPGRGPRGRPRDRHRGARAGRTASGWCRRRSRSSSTGCSTTTRSTAATPSSWSPRRWPTPTLKELEDAAVAVFDALGCAGVARVDFFLTDGGWVLNEVNTMPGFTEASQAPKMFAAAGLPYADLLDLLVSDALRGRATRAWFHCARERAAARLGARAVRRRARVLGRRGRADASSAASYSLAPYLLMVAGMMVAAALSRKAPGHRSRVVWMVSGLRSLDGLQ